MKVRVPCYAGRKADERPIRFQLGNHDYMVEEVLDQWYGPDDEFFKVRADDGQFLHSSASAAERRVAFGVLPAHCKIISGWPGWILDVGLGRRAGAVRSRSYPFWSGSWTRGPGWA